MPSATGLRPAASRRTPADAQKVQFGTQPPIITNGGMEIPNGGNARVAL